MAWPTSASRSTGGPTTDARVLANRREPAGEGETWLLGQVHAAAGLPDLAGNGALGQAARMASMMEVGPTLIAALARETAQTPAEEDGAAAREARMQGLLAGGPLDAATVERAFEAHTGHPMTAQQQAGIASFLERQQAIVAADGAETSPADDVRGSDGTAPAAPATNTAPPDGRAATTTTPATAIAQAASTGPAASAPATTPQSTGTYISARDARMLDTPVFFGTMVQQYAKRHGWLGRLPIVTRMLWRATAVVEAIVGIVVISVAVGRSSDVVTGLGVGILFGSFATWALARRMAQPTPAGGAMRAQLAAYRRTLQQTFAAAPRIDEAVGPSGLPWLTTPDQALVWGYALGLRGDIATLLARSDPAAAGASGSLYDPFWERLRRSTDHGHQHRATVSRAELFNGIEAIGSERGGAPAGLEALLPR
jgi:hypothetical protein